MKKSKTPTWTMSYGARENGKGPMFLVKIIGGKVVSYK